MNKSPYSKDGYIVRQAETADIPYGRATSDFSGCGWIAAHNFLLAMGERPDALDLSQRLATGWFKGRMGTGPLRLRRFLEAKGYVMGTAVTFRQASQLISRSPAGILLFFSSGGPHYVAFKAKSTEQKLFYNVSDTRKTQLATIEEFKRTNAKTSFCYLMVPK